jgi:hypothetical protein
MQKTMVVRWSIVLAWACLLTLSACSDGLKWSEDVRLPDGRVVTLNRQVEFEGPTGGPGGPHTESFQRIEFVSPIDGDTVVWENRRPNAMLGVVALWADGRRLRILTAPLYGGDEFKVGCPNPPYLVYEYSSGEWKPLAWNQIPRMAIRANVTTQPLYARALIERSRKHLTAEQTSNSLYTLANGFEVPYVVNLEPDIKQSFASQNCDRKRNYLIRKD